ncbi:MAG: PAS domain S-box protein [Proteobacteria bacterium]|nr:PAS domain S-box protein [Pseudomonadota bacterium]
MSKEHPLERRYRVALGAADIGIWTWSRSSGAVTFDDVASAITGFGTKNAFALEDWVGHAHAEDRSAVQAAIEGLLGAREQGVLEVEARFADTATGDYHWLALYGHAEFSNGQLEQLCGAVRDVTDSRNRQAESGRLEARLKAIMDIAADAIVTLDGDQRITLFNDGAERIFGYARAEMLGQPLEILLPERFRGAHGGHVRRFGAAGNVSRTMGERSEIFARRKDGSEFPAEASISHVEIAGERIYTAVLRDVSERKLALDRLASSHSELETRVAERTAELQSEMRRREETQAQLVRTQRMEAFGQLTGGVAHDFNNLLTVITGNLELIEMQLEDERLRKLLKRAQDAAEMGARLTSRLLTFARRKQFSPAPLNLNEQVMGMVDLLRRTLGEDVDLNARLAPKLWTVKADPSEVENAVLNLAINARDAMPRGGRLVIETANVLAEEGEIGTIDRLKAGAYVRLSVSDSGSGMPADVLSRAFEPFFTTKDPGKGTGLGLSTIYGFAQQSGGTATIYSELGIGTTVNLFLPRTDESAHVMPAGSEAEVPVAKGETVLLIEDNPGVREVTFQRLVALGYRILQAENGPAALALLEAGHKPDLVFSDVIMNGGLSGFDVAREVRSRWPEARLLLTSGYPDDLLRDEAPELQDLRILRKPYSRIELARSIRDVLDG